MTADFVKHARTVSILTFLSRLLGMLRDIILASFFGTTMAMNAFSVAFGLPNLFRRLFGEGALSVAYIPVFTELVEQKDRDGARRLAGLCATLLVAVLAAVTLVGEGVIGLTAALTDATPRLRLTLTLAAIMLPFVITICLVALLQATLNVLGHFAVPAAAPILLNLFIIGGALLGAPLWGDGPHRRIYGVAVCVLVAGMVQVAVQVPVLRRHGFRLRPGWDTASPHLRRIVTLMLPMMLGLGIVQLNVFMDRVIAMAFSRHAVEGAGNVATHLHVLGQSIAYPMKQTAVSVLYYGQRLYQLPLGVFVFALGTAIFPALSRRAHRRDLAGLSATLNRGLRMVTFIALPCSVGLILVAQPLIRVLFEHGRFGREDTPDVAWMAGTYAVGLLAYGAIHLLTRTFFALQDTRLPVRIAAGAAGVNFLLNLALIWPFGIQGLALSTVLTATGQTVALVLYLRRRVGFLGGRRYVASLWRIAMATALMAGAAWAGLRSGSLLGLEPGTTARAAAELAGAVVAGVAVYLLAARLLKLPELRDALGRGPAEPSAE